MLCLFPRNHTGTSLMRNPVGKRQRRTNPLADAEALLTKERIIMVARRIPTRDGH